MIPRRLPIALLDAIAGLGGYSPLQSRSFSEMGYTPEPTRDSAIRNYTTARDQRRAAKAKKGAA